MPILMTTIKRISINGRFYLLLVSSVLFVAVGPLVTERPFVSATLSSILLLSAIGCLRFRTSSFLASRWFGVIVLIVGWIEGLSPQSCPFRSRCLSLAFSFCPS